MWREFPVCPLDGAIVLYQDKRRSHKWIHIQTAPALLNTRDLVVLFTILHSLKQEPFIDLLFRRYLPCYLAVFNGLPVYLFTLYPSLVTALS